MSTIRELNFEVILDTRKFDKQIADATKMAQKFNKDLSSILDLKKKINNLELQNKTLADQVRQSHERTLQAIANTRKAQEAAREAAEKTRKAVEERRAAEEKAKQVADGTRAAMEGQTKAARNTRTAVAGTADVMRELSMLAGTTFGVLALKRFFTSLVEISGQFEVQKMALRTMLQDVNAADKIFQDLYEFSNKSTYTFSELAQHAKQLAGFGIDRDQLLETTKMLGDVASGLGVSMDRIILAYGHVKSSGFLRGIQLRSFSQNGVPILEELSKMLTEIEGKAVSLGDVFDKMTRREITFEMVEEAFKRMTGEGGKFYKMQETLANTLAGKINILRGKWENAMGITGMNNNNIIKDAVDWAIKLLDNLELVGAVVKSVLVGGGMYGIGLLIKGISSLAKNFYALIAPARAAAAGIKGFSMSLQGALGWIGFLATAVTSLVSSFNDSGESIDDIRNRYTELKDSIRASSFEKVDELTQKIDTLNSVLHDNASAYKDRENALLQLRSIVPDYHAQLTREGTLINDNTNALQDYKTALNAAAEAEAKHEYLLELHKKKLEVTSRANRAMQTFRANEVSYDLGTGWGVLGLFDVDWWAKGWNELTGFLSNSDAAKAEAARKEWQAAAEEYRFILAEIESVSKDVAADEAAAAKSLNEWQSKAKSIIDRNGDVILSPGVGKITAATNASDWADAVVKELREAEEELAKTPKSSKATRGSIKKRIDLLKELQREIDIDWSKIGPSGHIKEESGLTEQQKEEKDALETRVAYIKEYLSKFKALLDQGMTEEEAAKKMRELFPLADENLLSDTLSGYYRLLEAERDMMAARSDLFSSKNVASIANYIQDQKFGDQQKALNNAERLKQAVQAYKKWIDSWREQDFGLSGTGLEYDISKILRDFDKANVGTNEKADAGLTKYIESLTLYKDKRLEANDIILDKTLSDEEKIQKLRELNLENYSEEALREIFRLRDAELAANKATANDKLSSLSTKFLKEEYTKAGIDPTNLSKVSLGQLSRYRSELENIREKLKENLPLSAEMQKAIEDGELSLEDLTKAIEEALDKAGKNIDAEWAKDIAKLAKFAAGQVKNLAQKLGELGEVTKNDNLISFSEAVESIAAGVSNIAAGFAAGGPWGAAIAAVSTIASELINMSIAEEEAKKKAYDLREALRVLSMERVLSGGVDSVFGTDELQSVENAIRLMDELMSKLRAGREWVTQEARYRRNRSGRVIEMRPEIREILQAGDWRVRTYKSRSFNDWFGLKDDEYKTLNELAGGSIYDENGFIDLEKIKEIKNAYGDDGKNSFLDELVDDAEKYNEALKQVEDTMESVVGGIADDLADKFIDKWIEAKDVAIDYADALSDIAKQFAKMTIKQILFDQVFDGAKDQLMDLSRQASSSGDWTSVVSFVEGLMGDAQALGPGIQQVLEAYQKWFVDADSANTVGKGIAGITEDTASLLASYINAMRADLSAMRLMAVDGWRDVHALAERLSVPSLSEYLAACAANTYDIARSNAAILDEMRSVIGNPGQAGRVVRVEALM